MTMMTKEVMKTAMKTGSNTRDREFTCQVIKSVRGGWILVANTTYILHQPKRVRESLLFG